MYLSFGTVHQTQTFNLPTSYLPDAAAITSAFPSSLVSEGKIGKFGKVEGYKNPVAGWAEAGRAVEVGLRRFEKEGGRVRGGSEVVGLVQSEGSDGKSKVTGVKLATGEVIEADLVVLAAGAW